MIIASLQWYWIQLVRSNTDSYITIQLLADSQDEAELLALNQMISYDKEGFSKQYWVVHDSGTIEGCPYGDHETYNNVVFWEEEEDGRENKRNYYIALFPGARRVKFIRNIKRREDFLKYIDNLKEGLVECTP